MGDEATGDFPGKDQNKVLRQLDRMVSAGRVTNQEAERLRAADTTAAFEAAMGAIRARHAGATLDAAVADGQLTQPEAEDLQQRIRAGDHSAGLGQHAQQWRKLHRRPRGEQ